MGNSKLVTAHQALGAALAPIAEDVNVAAIMYPMPGNCEVADMASGQQIDFMPGADFITAWTDFWATQNDGGSTPLGAAMQVAEQVLAGELPEPDGNTAVVLMTDGQPNCGTNEGMVIEMAASMILAS